MTLQAYRNYRRQRGLNNVFKGKAAPMNLFVRCLMICMTLTALQFVGVTAQVDDNPDPTPCNPCRWTDVQWRNLPVEKVFVSIGDCTYEVNFRKRHCEMDGCFELKIINIKPTVPGDCSDLDPADAAQLVIGEMVFQNQMQFPPGSGDIGLTGYCWKIIRPACWTELTQQDSCDYWRKYGPDSTADPNKWVKFEDGDIAGCNDEECCTNMMFPILNVCGDLTFFEPNFWEYPYLMRNDDYYDPDFLDQFEPKECAPCMFHLFIPGIVGPCEFRCEEDFMASWRKTMGERLRKLYADN